MNGYNYAKKGIRLDANRLYYHMIEWDPYEGNRIKHQILDRSMLSQFLGQVNGDCSYIAQFMTFMSILRDAHQ